MRKRRSGPRTKSGKPSRAYATIARDHGTEEAQAKRKALVGDADPILSASVPGRLLAAEHIDRQQYDAVLRYRRLRCALIGPPWPGNSMGTEANESRLLSMKAAFAAMDKRMTPEQRHVVADVGVFDSVPTWFFVLRLGLKQLPEDYRERDLLLSGLDALVGRVSCPAKAA